ncbi:transcriptional repressor NrdR [Candidatus Nomurabacteria bacterium]|nr:transcriptional repressor NrdR [Candidatus Nomurabacteria bacterium]
MNCLHCQTSASRVIESRDLEGGSVIRRRRECNDCQQRFTTYERVESAQLVIIKKDGNRQAFSRHKLAAGLYRALEKRPVAQSKIESLINQIEQSLKSMGEAEVPSSQVGEEVMKGLLGLDQVAYIRFASVYRRFDDIESFAQELRKIRRKQ